LAACGLAEVHDSEQHFQWSRHFPTRFNRDPPLCVTPSVDQESLWLKPSRWLHLMAVLAEWERDQISTRTKAAPQGAKARGVRLGNPHLKADNKARSKAAKARAESL